MRNAHISKETYIIVSQISKYVFSQHNFAAADLAKSKYEIIHKQMRKKIN
jgi:hypothetical protein